MSKNKIKISTTDTIDSDEDKVDINSKNTTPISKLSESDKEILKVLKIGGFIQKPISMGKLDGIIDMHMMPK